MPFPNLKGRPPTATREEILDHYLATKKEKPSHSQSAEAKYWGYKSVRSVYKAIQWHKAGRP